LDGLKAGRQALRATEKYDTVLRDNVDLRVNTLTSKLIAAIQEGDFETARALSRARLGERQS